MLFSQVHSLRIPQILKSNIPFVLATFLFSFIKVRCIYQEKDELFSNIFGDFARYDQTILSRAEARLTQATCTP
jgi:hypothetical protein